MSQIEKDNRKNASSHLEALSRSPVNLKIERENRDHSGLVSLSSELCYKYLEFPFLLLLFQNVNQTSVFLNLSLLNSKYRAGWKKTKIQFDNMKSSCYCAQGHIF